MSASITIIFAYRNRDVSRVHFALLSLERQSSHNFEVIFVDYGSNLEFSTKIQNIVALFNFARYYYVGHKGLLWNKSKALNYGIKKASTPYVLTADIDLLFAKNTVELCESLKSTNDFYLFKIGYLSEKTTASLTINSLFDTLHPTHVGNTFGIGLYPKKSLECVHGLDEFFHFYGAEDEDLNARLMLSGVQQNQMDYMLFLHQWHPRYPRRKDKKLSLKPRLYKAERLNQRHHSFQQNMKEQIPFNQLDWGKCYMLNDFEILRKPSKKLTLTNINSVITHFLNVEIMQYKGEVLSVKFVYLPYYKTLRYYLKKLLGKETRDFISMKKINDMVLKIILFHYRDYNYSYQIASDFRSINLKIDLRND